MPTRYQRCPADLIAAGAARDGRMVMLGLLSGPKTQNPVDLSMLLFKRLRIEGTVGYESSQSAVSDLTEPALQS